MAGKTTKPFTGKHMAAILVGGFGIVVCVNFYMASLAVSGFHGTVVDNSYVASQQFNDWLEEAEAAEALGWTVETTRDEEGHVLVSTEAVPQGARVMAELRRPIGPREYASLSFTPLGAGRYRSSEPVAAGRWTMRLFIEAGGQHWAQESELPE
ncbi:FixH family protein [uncultured Erythrobacter sp.]|uniref:FixH family protein n=1 Tax=uncultured Erythrobacter sp. TaxID=263913 RepID=UPI00263127D8|nr:FixH family protein [uncultured Erythrobacter sp.]